MLKMTALFKKKMVLNNLTFGGAWLKPVTLGLLVWLVMVGR
jgi:hypothetical protein